MSQDNNQKKGQPKAFDRIDVSNPGQNNAQKQSGPQNNNKQYHNTPKQQNATVKAEKVTKKFISQQRKSAAAKVVKREQPRNQQGAKRATVVQRTAYNNDALSHQAPTLQSNHVAKNNGQTLKIVSLGGIGEIGKNMTLYQCGGDSFIVDCGMTFPDDELFGVDIVIPDFSYLDSILPTLRGIVITHGHEDHIGALPYLLKNYNIPLYGTKLTVGLIKGKLEEARLTNAKLNVIRAGQTIPIGCMSVEAIRVNHSIPDAIALAIRTPAGLVVQTGDFKIDYTPVFDETIDLTRFAQLGTEGVLALLSDSTNAEKPGTSMTESNVGKALENLFNMADGKRLIIASFASNIQRVQQIIDLAQRHGRKIALSGRSMEKYTEIALDLGYLKVQENVIIGVDEINRHRASDVIIITTGSQGEPMSALSRMASGSHRQIAITQGDMIIISASPIPGNERTINKVINDLLKLGSDVYYESMYETHASGHACQDELKLMVKLTKPKYFIPVHGEYKHLMKHARLAESVGVPPANVIIPEIGRVMEFKNSAGRLAEMVPAGRTLVDGFGVGDVGSTVLRDRKHLSQDGLMAVIVCVDPETHEVISGPDIISRGFVYVKESEALLAEARELVRSILDRWSAADGKFGRNDLKLRIREELSTLMYQKTKRSPMILPVIMEV